MVFANAVVDTIKSPGVGLGLFRVEVWGRSPTDYVRVYEIPAKDKDVAAREGLDRFVSEMSKLVKDNEDLH